MNCYKKAFTLTEILMAVILVGAVAALLIPFFTNSYGYDNWVNSRDYKVGMMRYQKLYNVLDNAIKESEINSQEINLDNLAKDLNATCSGNSCFDTNVYDSKLSKLGSYDLKGQIKLADGTQMMLVEYSGCTGQYGGASNICLAFVTDTNGKESPNNLGEDILTLFVDKNNILLPMFPGKKGKIATNEADRVTMEAQMKTQIASSELYERVCPDGINSVIYQKQSSGSYEIIGSACPKLEKTKDCPSGYTKISNADDLNNVRNNLSGKYCLSQNINLSKYENWQPIGNNSYPFVGILEGNGFTISSLKISRLSDNYVGLFGYAKNAAFSNLKFESPVVNGHDYVGTLVGRMELGSVSGVLVHKADIVSESSDDTVGIGGLIGFSKNVKITKVVTSGNINILAKGNKIGGILGKMEGGELSASNSSANIKTLGKEAGGIIGSQFYNSDSIVFNTYATGSVEGDNEVGGLLGNNCGTLYNSYSTGKVTGTGNSSISGSGWVSAGGLVGIYYGKTLYNSFTTGDVYAKSGAGGLIGTFRGDASSVGNVYTAGTISRSSGSSTSFGMIVSNNVSSNFAQNVYGKKQSGEYFGSIQQGNAKILDNLSSDDMSGLNDMFKSIKYSADNWILTGKLPILISNP